MRLASPLPRATDTNQTSSAKRQASKVAVHTNRPLGDGKRYYTPRKRDVFLSLGAELTEITTL
jgi:hypothetical protein